MTDIVKGEAAYYVDARKDVQNDLCMLGSFGIESKKGTDALDRAVWKTYSDDHPPG